MRINTLTPRYVIPALLFCLATLQLSPAQAGVVDKALSQSEDNIHREQNTQQRIDKLSEETQAMLSEYQALNRELDGLNVYNDQIQRLVDSQQQEELLLAQQIKDIDFTRQQIVPLMLRMIEQLDSFIRTDQPFLLDERSRRVQQLVDLMDRSDVTLAEKYRRILEAYQIELDYSRTLEAYQEEIQVGDVLRTVEVLRVGRTGLYYQALDRQSAAYWDNGKRAWVDTDATQRRAIQRGLRIASQQLAPELLELPVAAAGDDDE